MNGMYIIGIKFVHIKIKFDNILGLFILKFNLIHVRDMRPTIDRDRARRLREYL